MTSRRVALAALAALAAPAALACGVCAEDKIAATYDHASVQQALARGKVVVYCDLAGVREAGKVRAAAARLRGVDPRSVRVSDQPPAMSFVLDPAAQSPGAAVLTLQATPGAQAIALIKVESGAARPAVTAARR